VIKQGVPDEDDEESWLTFFGKSALTAPAGLVPGGRELSSYLTFGTASGPYTSFVETVGGSLKAGYDVAFSDEDLVGNWADFMEGVAAVLALPLSQPIKIVEDFFHPTKSDDAKLESIMRRVTGDIGMNVVEAVQ